MFKKSFFGGVMGFFSLFPLQGSEVIKDESSIPQTLWQLPCAEVLEKNITKALGAPYFAEKTQLHEKLGGQRRYNSDLDRMIELSYNDFFEYLKQTESDLKSISTIRNIMEKNKFALKIAILKKSKEIKSEN